MPYYEESPFGAAVGVAGGIFKGQQQQKEYQQQMQQQALANAMAQRRLQDEEQYQQFDENDKLRTRAIAAGNDPDTGKPITSEMPHNLQVPVSSKASLQDQYNKLMQIGGWLYSKGYKDQAYPSFQQAGDIAQRLGAQVTFDNDLKKMIIAGNVTTNREVTMLGLRGQQDETLLGERLQGDAAIHGAPTYADLHPRPGSNKTVPTVGEVNSMLNEWAQGVQTQTGTQINPGGKPIPTYARVPPDPAQRTFVTSAISQIQHSKNPVAAATGAIAAYKKNFKNADPQAVRILQAAADEAGGSNVTSDPPPPQGWGQP